MCFDSISTYVSFSHYPVSSFGQSARGIQIPIENSSLKILVRIIKKHDARCHLRRHNTESADFIQCILELILEGSEIIRYHSVQNSIEKSMQSEK